MRSRLTAACGGVLVVAAGLAAPPAAAQRCDGVRGDRVAAIAGAYVAGEALMVAAHPSDWWQGPPRSFRFTWINGGGSPAAGQDFLLHVAASYQASQAAALAWRWACAPPLAAAWLGAATAFAFGLPKKVVDGFHDPGFEAAKVLTNAVGAALPVAHAVWPATRTVALKVWYWPSRELRERTGTEPNLVSDYAGQRYYLSINPARGGLGGGWWPRWLGLAIGHSTPGWVTEIPARHEWYVALDLELRGLPIRAGWWPRVAAVLDQIHFPAPGVRVRNGGLSVGLF
jgi:hypothetical protein